VNQAVDTTNYGLIFILMAFLVVFGLIAVGVIIWLDKSTPTSAKQSRLNISKNGMLKKLRRYKFLDDFFLTRGGIRTVYARVSELSVYTSMEARVVAVNFYQSSTIMLFALTATGAFVFKDLFNTLLVFLFAYVMKTMMIDKQIDKIHYKLLKQLLDSLSNVRQAYLRLESIPDAINEAEIGPYLHRAFNEVYLVLTSADSEHRLEELYESTPFRIVQTFATVSFLLNEIGDSKDSTGTFNYILALDMLEAEVRLEVRKLALMKAEFGILEILPVAPLVAIKGVEVFFSSTIPGTTVIYNGPLGYFSKVLTVLISLICYIIIVKVNSAIPVKRDDRTGLALSLLDWAWWDKFIENLRPKLTKKLQKKEKQMKGALSMLDIKTLYSKKVVTGLFMFALTLFVLFFSVNLGKEFIWRNTAEASLVAGKPLSIKETKERERMDVIYMRTVPQMSQKETLDFVDASLPKLQEYDRQAQVQRLLAKYRDYNEAYFKWWMILVAYFVGLIGWFIPEIGLMGRAWILKAESEEDVLQQQTLIAILMNTSIDTLDTLYWLQKNSRVHSRLLRDCYHEYPGEPRLALERLKSKVSSSVFKRIVDKLMLTVSQITLAEAFSDLVSERDHVLRMREMVQMNTIKKKRQLASPLSQLPLYLLAILFILVPMGILGVKEFVSAMKNFNL